MFGSAGEEQVREYLRRLGMPRQVSYDVGRPRLAVLGGRCRWTRGSDLTVTPAVSEPEASSAR
jgi:hypothetical protein